MAAFLFLTCLIILAALIALFARDFVVPVMALENVGIIDGWRRVIALLSADKKAYVGYVLMKIVLVVGSTILFGILTLIAVLLFLIPISIAGAGLYFFARSAGLLTSFPAIAVAVILAAAALEVIFYASAIHFGSRHDVLPGLCHPLPGSTVSSAWGPDFCAPRAACAASFS